MPGRRIAPKRTSELAIVSRTEMVKYNAPSLASSGYVARVDASKCKACGKCGKACPFEAVKTDKASVVQWDKCMGCGVCVDQCSNGAMSLVRDEKKGVPFKEDYMISRIWHGWTTPENADAYEALLKSEIFIGIRNRGIAGFRGIQLLRRNIS